MKPMLIAFANFSSRKTCLCTKHQNIALKIRCLRGYGMQTTKNPDMFITNFLMKMLYLLLMRSIRLKSKDFKQLIKNELSAFRDHVERVSTQYREMKRLRENFPDGHILVQMDLSENLVCSSVEEIQSAYWNMSMISLHTMVVYFPNNHSKKLQSIVAISDLINHNATAVHTILRKKHTIHYLSDSPTSQYRNRYIFQLIAYHEEEFSIKARLHFLESGHGKGPCDGLGGSVKRSADMAVRQAKCNIQDAADFYAWGLQSELAGRKRETPLSVTGTMKLHAVVPSRHATKSVYTRNVSGWELHALSVESNKTSEENMQMSDEHRRSEDQHKDHYSGNERQTIIPKENDFVAAIYDKNWYIGRWIREPVPYGKTKRLFKIPKEVTDRLEEGFVSLKDGL
ncbi:hypothetical protein ACJMK2_008743 [Sinanodonta woodiana]|uniref:Uncharacterized protein n=1 Tax=Sinanodonta woodiana TaxID=1069815 RepID=A0ABD3VMS4_SINWO